MVSYRIRADTFSRLVLLTLIVQLALQIMCVHAASNPRVIAEAFECDDNLQAIDSASQPPRTIGHEFHICIEPNLPTRHRNVRMRSIDRFGFFKEGTSISQVIIDKGMESDRTLTLLLCVPGSITCSFKTTILPEFFYASTFANVTGIGEASMQMAANGYRGRQLTKTVQGHVAWRGGQSPKQNARTETAKESHRRELSVEGDFAGQDEVEITIPLELVNPPRTTVLDTDDIDGNWWQEAPNWVRAVIMAVGLLLLLMLLCLLFYCLYILMFRRDERRGKASDYSSQTESEADAAFPVKTLEFTECEDTERDCTMVAPFNEGEQGWEEENPNVYFDSHQQPGTIAFYNALDKTIKTYKNEEFSPEIYRFIKLQLPGRLFFFFDFNDDEEENAGDGEWKELPKKELVKRIKQEFDDRRLAMGVSGNDPPIPRRKSSETQT